MKELGQSVAKTYYQKCTVSTKKLWVMQRNRNVWSTHKKKVDRSCLCLQRQRLQIKFYRYFQRNKDNHA